MYIYIYRYSITALQCEFCTTFSDCFRNNVDESMKIGCDFIYAFLGICQSHIISVCQKFA